MQRFAFATPISRQCPPAVTCAARANIHRGPAPPSFRSVSDFSLFARFSPPALSSGLARKNFGCCCCCFHASFVPPFISNFLGGRFAFGAIGLSRRRCRVWRRPARNEVTSSPRLLKKRPKWRAFNPLATQSRGHITRASRDPFVVRRRIAGHRAGPSSFFLVLQPLLVHSTSADLAVHGEV